MPILRLRGALCLGAAALLAACADVPTQSARTDDARPRASTYASTQTDLGCCGIFEDVSNSGLLVGARDLNRFARAAAYTPAMGFRFLQTLDSVYKYETVDHAFGVNDLGQIVGHARNRYGVDRPVLWQSMNAVPVDLGELSPGGAGEARDLNSSGWIVGRAESAPGVYRAFVWLQGTMLDIGPGIATAINDSAHAVGAVLTPSGQYRAFKWRYGFGRQTLPTLGGSAAAYDINSRGDVVGVAANAQGADRAFLWTQQGGIQDLGTLGGRYSVATGISDYGVVVGYSELGNGATAAFAWSPRTGMRRIDHTPFGGTWAHAVSRGGLVAGVMDGGHPMFWRLTETNTRPSVVRTTDVVTLWEGETGLFAYPWTSTSGTQYFQYEWEDAEGDPLTSEWSFGDGSTLGIPASKTESTVAKMYRDQGTYTVRLIVKDPSAARDTLTAQVTILNRLPTATFQAPGSRYEGSGYELSFRDLKDGPADLQVGVQAAWDCGTGTFSAYAIGTRLICPAVMDDATMDVGLRLRDKDGAVTEYRRSIPIYNAAPVASVGSVTPRTIAPGGSFTARGSFTDPGTMDGPWQYRFAWGDGTFSFGTATAQGSVPQASHVYAAAGSYAVSLWVTDKDGRTGKATPITVTVGP